MGEGEVRVVTGETVMAAAEAWVVTGGHGWSWVVMGGHGWACVGLGVLQWHCKQACVGKGGSGAGFGWSWVDVGGRR